VKRSSSIRLTVVAAVGIAAHGEPRLDPCAASSFSQQACEAAIQNRGYCWNGRWVNLKYHYPFPYYYDAYLEYTAAGGVVNPAVVGECSSRRTIAGGSHFVVNRAGFGSAGACHAAHS
jgi:hypothetical protein